MYGYIVYLDGIQWLVFIGTDTKSKFGHFGMRICSCIAGERGDGQENKSWILRYMHVYHWLELYIAIQSHRTSPK